MSTRQWTEFVLDGRTGVSMCESTSQISTAKPARNINRGGGNKEQLKQRLNALWSERRHDGIEKNETCNRRSRPENTVVTSAPSLYGTVARRLALAPWLNTNTYATEGKRCRKFNLKSVPFSTKGGGCIDAHTHTRIDESPDPIRHLSRSDPGPGTTEMMPWTYICCQEVRASAIRKKIGWTSSAEQINSPASGGSGGTVGWERARGGFDNSPPN